jgi:hypothetical protein
LCSFSLPRLSHTPLIVPLSFALFLSLPSSLSRASPLLSPALPPFSLPLFPPLSEITKNKKKQGPRPLHRVLALRPHPGGQRHHLQGAGRGARRARAAPGTGPGQAHRGPVGGALPAGHQLHGPRDGVGDDAASFPAVQGGRRRLHRRARGRRGHRRRRGRGSQVGPAGGAARRLAPGAGVFGQARGVVVGNAGVVPAAALGAGREGVPEVCRRARARARARAGIGFGDVEPLLSLLFFLLLGGDGGK